MLMEVKLSKKEVTNQEFSDAYYGGATPESQVAAANNRGILRAVTSKYLRRGQLDEDECSSCEMRALWKALQYHNESYGQKFTTSLYKICGWVCNTDLKRKRLKLESRLDRKVLPRVSRHVVDEHDTWAEEQLEIQNVDGLDEIKTRLEKLPYDWQKNIISQYYLQGMTCEEIGFHNGGYSKETARLRLDQALSELKVCC